MKNLKAKNNLFLQTTIELVNEKGKLHTLIPTIEECYYYYSKGIVVNKIPDNPYFVLLTLEK